MVTEQTHSPEYALRARIKKIRISGLSGLVGEVRKMVEQLGLIFPFFPALPTAHFPLSITPSLSLFIFT